MGVGDQLRRLVYRIDADASGVERGMDRADATVEAKMDLIRRQKAIIKLQGDASDLDSEMRAARLKLKRFREERTDLPISADTSAFDRAIALVEAEIASLRRQKATIKVDLDEQGRAYQSARRLTSQMHDLGEEVDTVSDLFERWGKRIVGTRVNLGPFTTNLRTLGGVLVFLGPVITGIVGSITALAGSLTEAAGGALVVGAAGFAGLAASAAGAFFAIKPLATAFKEVSTAQLALKTAQDKYGKSSDEAKNAAKQLDKVLAAQPPHIQEIETRWTALKDAFQRRTGGIRTDAVSVINDALRTAQRLLPAFARESERTFHVAAQGVHEWLQGLRSSEAEHLLTTIMGNFRRSLPDLLHGLGQFATAFTRITAVASEFLPEFTEGFDEVATDFANSTESGRNLHNVIGGLVDQTHSWFGLLGATGRLLTTILTGGATEGQNMIEDFTRTLDEWNQALSSTAGQRNMAAFFEESRVTTELFLGTLRRVLTILFALSRATEPLAQGFLNVANFIGDIVTAADRLAPLRSTLTAIGTAIATYFVASKISGFITLLATLPDIIRRTSTATAAATALNPWAAALAAVAGAAVLLSDALRGSRTAMQRVDDMQRAAERQARASARAVRDERDAYRELKAAALDLASSHLDLQQAKLDVAAAGRREQAVEDKFGKNSRQYKQARIDLRRSELDLRYAKRGVTDATHRETEASRESQRQYAKVIGKQQQSVQTLKSERGAIHDIIAADRKQIELRGDSARTADGERLAVDDLKDAQQRLRQNTQDLHAAQSKLNDRLDAGAKLFSFMEGPIGRASTKEDQMRSKSDRLGSELRTLGRTLGGVGKVGHNMGQVIGDVTNKILSSFGAKKLSFSLPSVGSLLGSLAGALQRGGVAGRDGYATGGSVVPGSGDGDRYRTTVPPGTFIMNRRASAAYGLQGGGIPVALEAGERMFSPQAAASIGYDRLAAMNASVPRFAKGGVAKPVELFWHVPDHFDHLHAGFATTAQTIAAGRVMQGMGYEVGEGPGPFGPITPGVHVGGSLHYQNRAIDVNDDVAPIAFGNSEDASLSHLFAMLQSGKISGAGSTKIKRIVVKGPPGPARDALQAQADTLRREANRYIANHMPVGGGMIGGMSGNFNEVWRKVNPDLSKWAGLMGRIVSVESGGDAHAGGPGTSNPGHAGWYQYDASTWAGDAPRGAPGWPEGPYDPGIASAGAGNAIRSDGMAGVQQRWTNWDGVAPHLAGGGFVGMQQGGIPGVQHIKLPPKPRGRPKKDFSTDVGSWYDWYGRAIDFYDTRGDTRNEAGNRRGARGDWLSGLGQVRNEEDQVQRIIHHDKHRMHALLRDMKHLPKHLRRSEPPKHFHFRDRKKGESHAEWSRAKHDARHELHQRRRDWERQVKDYKARFKQRRETIRSELPDLWQQLRVDLPTRYNDIREKLTGQKADIGLEQTASGQERYQALTEFGGNFAALGFGVGTSGSRFGGHSAAGMGLGGGPARAASGMGLGTGPSSTRAPASSGPQSVTHDNRRDITVVNNYKKAPSDPHTWSASMRHELGALA